ncbi:NAD(P)-binding protein [Aspergillus steynii IBT 23096]|uniref:NAD(P)-binding protein n=1 Tax=Aspergillus steynii IBT 23096 TaxID=1392250 RepID=A0A2I2GK91_9EURO|nr:NAD(P)-binding protein [Aspergillus steynii IBT 23096]PLB53292.1 NAD(P)-binding protein [Aspergillus steynii IBT 23096]
MSRILITGVTGYIGGDVLYGISQALTSSSIVALVRNEARAAAVTEKFPSVTPLIGDLDSTAIIRQEAQEADVVLNLASSSHGASAKAIAEGLAKTERKSPGVSEVQDIITTSPKRVVDHILRDLNFSQPNIRTATVYGPLIYGQGRGPVNKRSIQLPDLAKATLNYGHGVHVGRGLNAWSNIHITDLTRLIVALVLEASRPSNPQLWNANGVFFAESGRMSFGDISKRISVFAHSKGLIRSPESVDIDAETADSLTPHGSVLWGTNVQYQAIRARELLGWCPQGPSLEEEIPRATLVEATSGRSKSLEKLA